MQQFTGSITSKTFCNVRGNRNSCALQLTGQSKFFMGGEGGGCSVNCSHQLNCLLPDFQAAVSALHTLLPSPLTLPVLLLVLHFGELGIDHVAFILFGFMCSACTGFSGLGLFCGVHFFAQLLRRSCQ